MKRTFELIAAVACCAISWPVIGFKDNEWRKQLGWRPIPPSEAKLDIERNKPDVTWFHLKKDLLVEYVRSDAEWWAKFFSHVTAWLLTLCVALLVCLIALLY